MRMRGGILLTVRRVISSKRNWLAACVTVMVLGTVQVVQEAKGPS